MHHISTHAARQAGLAWRLTKISAAINTLLLAGIIAAGCYSVLFNNNGYIAVDNNLHLSTLYPMQDVNPYEFRLVDNIYAGKENGNLLKEGQGTENTKETGSEGTSAKENE